MRLIGISGFTSSCLNAKKDYTMDDKKDNVVELKPKSRTGKGAGRRKVQPNDPLTVRQEAFAQALAAGLPFDAAFKRAYNTANYDPLVLYKRSHREKNHPKIQRRVKELQQKMALAEMAHLTGAAPIPLPAVMTDAITREAKVVSDVIINRQTLTHKLLKAADRADELGQISATVAALKELGKLHQLTTDNREANKLSEVEQMNPAQLRQFIQDEIQKVGLVIELTDGSDLLELVDMRPPTNTKQ